MTTWDAAELMLNPTAHFTVLKYSCDQAFHDLSGPPFFFHEIDTPKLLFTCRGRVVDASYG